MTLRCNELTTEAVVHIPPTISQTSDEKTE